MTYPPGSPGYPPAQQPTQQFAAPTQQFGKAPDAGPAAAEGPSQLPVYLTAAVAALGLIVYLSSFGPQFTASADFFTPTLLDLGVVASLLAGLIAGAALLPKQKARSALVAVLSVLAFLLVIAIALTAPDGVSLDWGLYLILAFTLLQAIVAAAVLLFDAGVITPPVPRPKYEQPYGQYGAPGGCYYGQPPSRWTAPAAGAAAASAASRISVALRRLRGWWAIDRRIPGRPAERTSDAADRIPDLRPAAVQLGSHDTGPGTAVVFLAVRPRAVVV